MEFIDNEFVIPGYVADLLDKIGQEKGFTSFSTTVTSDPNAKDGFMGIVCRIKLIGTKTVKGMNVDESIDLIAKMLPLSKIRREQFQPMPLFEREIILYRDILPDFIKFQEEKNIKPEEGFFNFPKCYGTYWDEVTEDCVILMEDLTIKNFEMWNRLKPVDFDHSKLLMEQLGKYHAISLAMKEQDPKRFEKCTSLKDNLFSPRLTEEHPFTKMFDTNFIKAAESLEPFEDSAEKKVMKLKDTLIEFFQSLDDTDSFEPFAVLTHGDCWNNNMMYQYNDTRRTPKKICLIDFQMSRYTTPVLDIVYFIFTSTDKQLRTEQYENLIRIYYEHLSQHLTRLGSNPEKLFTFNDLLDQLKRFGRYGLVMATMLIPMVTTETKDIPNMDELSEQIHRGDTFDGTMIKEVNIAYKDRMSDVIRDTLSLGYY